MEITIEEFIGLARALARMTNAVGHLESELDAAHTELAELRRTRDVATNGQVVHS